MFKPTTLLHAWLLAGTALAAGGALAQSAPGPWSVRIGATQISPQVKSGDLSAPSPAGTQADVRAASQLTGGLSYRVSDTFSLDLPLALPFKHDLVGAGAIAGAGKIGDVKALPATLLAQYRFRTPASAVRPYVGAGPTYAYFFGEKSTAVLTGITGGSPSQPTTLKVDGALGLTLQAGASFDVNDRWFVDGSIIKTLLKTKTTLSTGQTLDIRLDPLAVGIGIGYRY